MVILNQNVYFVKNKTMIDEEIEQLMEDAKDRTNTTIKIYYEVIKTGLSKEVALLYCATIQNVILEKKIKKLQSRLFVVLFLIIVNVIVIITRLK